jgi:hypothetical protein
VPAALGLLRTLRSSLNLHRRMISVENREPLSSPTRARSRAQAQMQCQHRHSKETRWSLPLFEIPAVSNLVHFLARVPFQNRWIPQKLTHDVRKRQATHALGFAALRSTAAPWRRSRLTRTIAVARGCAVRARCVQAILRA